MQKLDEYVKIAEAARILGVSQNTLRAWCERGKVRMTRNPVNGYRLFRRSDLEAFLNELECSFEQPSEESRLPRKPK